MDGQTIAVDLYGCKESLLKSIRRLYAMLEDLPKLIGMTPISAPWILRWGQERAKEPSDWGYTGGVIFAESHMHFHNWPARGYMMVDITSCKGFDASLVEVALKTAFGASDVTARVIPRMAPR